MKTHSSDASNVLWWVDPEGKPRFYLLNEGSVFVGRLADQDLLKQGFAARTSPFEVYIFGDAGAHPTGLVDATVSRRHAKISFQRGILTVQDHGSEGKGSKNGTFINDVNIGTTPRRLSEGDVIRLSAYASFKSRPVEFVVANSNGSTVSVRLPSLKPITPFSPSLRNPSLTEEVSEDTVVIRDDAEGEFVHEGIRYRISRENDPRIILSNMIATLQGLTLDISEGLRAGEKTLYERAANRLKTYVELNAHRNLLERLNEPKLVKLSDECVELARNIVLGYADRAQREELLRKLEEYIFMLDAIRGQKY